MKQWVGLFLSGSLFLASVASADDPPPFLLQWGSLGSADGQFISPASIATDADGNVYVADSGNNRIQKFTGTGVYITQWGTTGTGDGQFNVPYGVATDTAGNVYVADYLNHRIQKFTSSGTYLTQWGTHGTGDGQFTYPIRVTVDADGNVYVADSWNHRMEKFTSSGTYLTQWGSAGSGDGQFTYPHGMAVDRSGNVYVADSGNNRVQKFTSTGTYLTQWGEFGSGDGQLYNPADLAMDAAGNIYVSDYSNDRIEKFTSTGTYLTQWGDFTDPLGVATDAAGNVFVSDTNNNRIAKYGPFVTCVQLPSGGLGWWPGDGNEIDIVGGNNGTLQNGVTFAPGRIGQAFQFDGVDDFVSLPETGLDLPSITVDAWVKLATTQASRIIMAKYVQPTCCSTRGWGLGISDSSVNVVKWFTSMDDGSNDTIFSTTTLVNDTWYHVAATFDGTTKRLFVNGVLEASRTWANPIGYTNTVSSIGNLRDVGLQFFDGQIDEVEIFNRALTEPEIRAMYDAGSSGKCKGDTDGDGGLDYQDNCPFIPNPSQQDADGDSAGDECDCAPADLGVFALPGEIRWLEAGADGDKSRLAWGSVNLAAGPATVYDVAFGTLAELPVGSGPSETCLPSGSFANPTATHPATPLPDGGFWYLVRGRNACGAGTYGYGINGTERITTVCP